MWFPVTVTHAGVRHDVHLDAGPQVRVADLTRALCEYFSADGMVCSNGTGRPLEASASLVSAGVVAGASLTLAPPGVRVTDRPPAQRSGSRGVLRVVAGPDAGLVIPLPDRGRLTIGRAPDNAVVVDDSAASRRHARLDVDRGRVAVTDLRSSNGTYVDDVAVEGARQLAAGSVLGVGDNRMVLTPARATGPRATVAPLPDGTVRLVRQHRYLPPPVSAIVDLPRPPSDSQRGSAYLGVGAFGGLVLGVVAYLVWHNIAFLILSAASTATMLVSGVAAWLGHRRRRRRDRAAYSGATAEQQAKIERFLAEERVRRVDEAPNAVEVVETAERPGHRLWERRPGHDDFLAVRIGLGEQRSGVVVRDPESPAGRPAPVLADVPVVVPLGTIGVLGPVEQRRGLARWLVVQAVVHSGPADVSVAVLTAPGDEGARVSWDWVRWLPHARPADGPLAWVGSDDESIATVVRTLGEVVADRRRASGNGRQARRFAPVWLVVVDGLAEHDVPGLADVLSQGADHGLCVVAVGQRPYPCPATAEFTDRGHVLLRVSGAHDLDGVLADQLGVDLCERVARALAPLRDPDSASTVAGLPASVPLLELVPDGADPAALLRRWRDSPRTTAVPIGRTAKEVLSVDIVSDGPHALVAGTTGSGKSAFLQALVGSLALANRPDELGFLLIDFKGGAAFAAFKRLPHVLDTITNLDGRRVMRALDSLAGEMDRRQVHLKTAGCESLGDYQRKAAAGTLPPGCPAPLPRLVIVIDEFAMLRENLPPEIMTRLIHVAIVGRSLGLHLVIGTQTPRGVVPAEIRPNVNLKVALRLTEEHSRDVVGVPDAHRLTVAGRAILGRGEDGSLAVFQSAYLGGHRRRATGVRVVDSSWDRLGSVPAAVTSPVRDMDTLVAAVCDAAESGGLVGPARPWLPDLPAVLPLGDVSRPAGTDLLLRYGYEDLPEQRSQPVAAWNLSRGTHLLIAGRPLSGRSTALRTIAVSAAEHRVHLYVLDGGGALGDLASLPYCGAVVTPNEPDRVARLLNRVEHVAGAAATGVRTIVLVDQWEIWLQAFDDIDNGAPFDQLLRIVRRGPAAGVHIAVAGGSALLVSGRTRALSEAAQDRIALPFDADEYLYLGVPRTALPTDPAAGQAIRLTDPYRSVQIAVVGAGPDRSAQARAVAEFARSLPAVSDRPPRVDPLPDRFDVAFPRTDSSPLWVPVGVGGDELAWRGIDLHTEGPATYVAGERRSGRSTALLTMAVDLIRRGTSVVAFAPSRQSPLRELSGRRGIAALMLHPRPNRRMVQLALAAAGGGPCVVLVDDAEQIRGDAASELRDFVVDPGDGCGLVAATDSDAVAVAGGGSLLGEVGRAGIGLLLAPRTARPLLFGVHVKLPGAFTGGETGRAVLIRRGGQDPVRLPDTGVPDLPPPVDRPGRVRALLETADHLLGPQTATLDQARAVVNELRNAGFDALDEEALHRLGELAPGWSESPTELVALAQANAGSL
jgi:S-DNA-T family DNA segregation ATPase FtsK/SpoIIIE